MSDVLHLQASDALLMQATFYATALKRERELREGQAQLLEQLRRQLAHDAKRAALIADLIDAVDQFNSTRAIEGADPTSAIEHLVAARCELEEHDERARGIDREEEVEAYRSG